MEEENAEQCSELPTTSAQTMRTDHGGPWSRRVQGRSEFHGPSRDRLQSVWQNRRSPIVTRILLESSNGDIANYWSSQIVSRPWVDMVGPQPDLSPAHRVQKGLRNHRLSADRRVGLTDV